MGPRRVTLVDVARAADVDVSLVSRIVRGMDVKVREETRERILLAAERLGYRPNAIARSLKTAKAGAFGLVIPTFTNPVYAQIITGAEAAAAKLGSVLLTMSAEGWDRGQALEAMEGGRIDGLLLTGGSSLDLSHVRVPHLLVNRAVPGVDRSIVLDDERASRMAVEHLVALGHRRIAFLAGPQSADTARRRLAGFQTACADAGLAPVADPIPGNYTFVGGRDAMRRSLGSRARFTGIVAANVPSAVGALQAHHDAGVEVPAEVSIVAIHDAEIAEMVRPRLTTVQMPLARLGGRAIELLASTSAADTIDEVVERPMELIVRDSTGQALDEERV